ncbi:MAG: PD-(D/E)XK nuclease family protein [Gemmatimonadaceae bacterium]|nr:PD-(D/E)XK nuclease family protein [Gemmatimonadaceae bacterium]
MATLRTILAPDPARLLTRAAEGLFPLAPATSEAPWPTLPAWIVLRQGGLRDDFHALAARHGVAGWFDPTVCLFKELGRKWDAPSAPPLRSAERTVLLSEIVRTQGVGVFGHGAASEFWVPSIDSLIGEMIAEGITVAALRAAFTAVDAAQPRDAFEKRRDDALTAIYAEWHHTLDRLQRSDGRATIISLARSINSDPSAFATRLGHRRDIRIVGLASLRGGYTTLLRALRDCPVVDTVTLLSSDELELPADLQPERLDDRTVDGAGMPLARALFPDTEQGVPLDAAAVTGIHLLETPDLAREVESIAVRVRALLDADAEASRIAVIYRNERPGVDAMAAALTAIGVPISARRRTALHETAPARAVRALLNAMVDGWSRHALLEVAENPLLHSALDVEVIDLAGRLTVVTALDDWDRALTELLARCSARDERGAGSKMTGLVLPETRRVSDCRDAWREWLPKAQAMDQPRTRAAWFDWMNDLLDTPGSQVVSALREPPAGDFVVWSADLRARDGLTKLAREWSAALQEFGTDHEPVSAEQFTAELVPLLDTDIVSQSETDFGVVVSEAMAAGWRAFDHVFIAGLVSEEFPLRAPTSAILSDRERVALIEAGLSLDHPEQWGSREQALFRVLCASPRASLTLSWASMSPDGREVIRSRFIDDVIDLLQRAHRTESEAGLETAGVLARVMPHEVLTRDFPLVVGVQAAAAAAHALEIAQRERQRSTSASPWNGCIEDAELQALMARRYGEDYVWSATQLEGLAKCGWSWFGERVLKLSPQREASDDIEPSAFGSVLHEALDLFFADARTSRAEEAIHLRPEDRAWVMPMAQRALAQAWQSVSARVWMGNPLYHVLVQAELESVLEGYLEFEMEWNAKSENNRTGAAKQLRTGVIDGELPFERVRLTADGTSFLLRGSIDRVDRGVDTRVAGAEQYIAAVDYKTSKGSTPGGGVAKAWDDGVVLQVPLYAEVLRQLYPEARLAHLEYRTLRAPKVVHQLKFVNIRNAAKKPSTLEMNPGAEEQMNDALAAAARRVNMARRGELPTNPTASCGCSPYCASRDVCRVPGGPVAAGWKR